jgi:type IV secretory pathway TrbD component
VPLPAGLWQPFMWAYCEGTPMGVVLLIAIPGPLIIRTWSSAIASVVFFLIAWILFRALGTWDPRAYRVFKRARRYRNARTATLPSRASWSSPPVNFAPRRH